MAMVLCPPAHLLRAAICALAIALLAAPPDARALTPEQEAALAIYKEGKAHFKAGRYGDAAEHFGQALRVVNDPGITYYLGRSLAETGRCDEALVHLDAVAGKLGDDSKGLAAERLRASAVASCALRIARHHMVAFRCHAAAARLAKVDSSLILKRERSALTALVDTATACASAFDTTTEPGQRAARLHTTARDHLAAGDHADALRTARASLAALPTPAAHLIEGLAAAHLGQCPAALAALAPLPVPPKGAAAFTGALRDCRLSEARRLVKADDCRAAMPLLDALDGALKGKAARWRAKKAAWCRPRSTEFLTDTVARQSAHTLLLAAREAAAAGEFDLAVARYEKALALADEALLHRELAALHLAAGACDAGTAALGDVPPSELPREAAAHLARCRGEVPVEEEPEEETDPGPVVDPEASGADLTATTGDQGADWGAVAGWTLIGVGAASVAGCVVFAVDHGAALGEANAAAGDIASADLTLAAASIDQVESARERMDIDQTLAITFGVIGAATALGGTLLLLLGGEDAPEASAEDPSALSLRPVVGPRHLGLFGRF